MSEAHSLTPDEFIEYGKKFSDLEIDGYISVDPIIPGVILFSFSPKLTPSYSIPKDQILQIMLGNKLSCCPDNPAVRWNATIYLKKPEIASDQVELLSGLLVGALQQLNYARSINRESETSSSPSSKEYFVYWRNGIGDDWKNDGKQDTESGYKKRRKKLEDCGYQVANFWDYSALIPNGTPRDCPKN